MGDQGDRSRANGDALEELAGHFSAAFEVSTEPNRIEAAHPRFALYKNKSRTIEDNQDERRQKRLKEQKSKRFDLLQQLRGSTGDGDGLLCGSDESSVDSAESQGNNVSMDNCSDTSMNSTAETTRFRKYRNFLMMSEWLVDVPSDFISNWLLVLCPVGKRCLVVASHGETKAYGRNGFCFKSRFPSLIPGGNKRDVTRHKESCILDCIFCERRKMFFILDLLAWNGMSFRESETEFRRYWLNSKLKEMKGVASASALNPYRFQVLPHFTCDKDSVRGALSSLPFQEELDGLLFFHKESHYVSEVTPLVCWLKLDMLPSILGIPVDNLLLEPRELNSKQSTSSSDNGQTAGTASLYNMDTDITAA